MTVLLLVVLMFVSVSPALASISITFVTNNSSVQELAVDNNDCVSGGGPRATYLGVEIQNTSGATLTDLEATLSDLDPGFDLAGGQPATLFIGKLEPGQRRQAYWYISYPCTTPLTDTLTVTVQNAASVMASDTIDVVTVASNSTQAGGKVVSATLNTASAVLGEIIELEIVFEFGNTRTGDEFYLQPAANDTFNAACFQLLNSVVTASQVDAIPVGGTALYYQATANQNQPNGPQAEVTYYFRYQCDGVNTTASPSGSQSQGGNSLQFSNNFGILNISFPPGTNPFTIAKTASPTTLTDGGVVTYTVTITNTSTANAFVDQIVDVLPSGAIYGDITGSSDITAANSNGVPAPSATGTLTWTGIPETSYLVPANGVLRLIYTVNLPDVDGTYTNSVTVTSGSETLGPVTATVTVTSGVTISGTVYGDTNHNAQLDSGEVGTSLALMAKLLLSSTPTGPALQAVPVNPTTGIYQLSGVAPETYTIIVDDNATLTDVTPTLPSGWIGTQVPDQIRSNVGVSSLDITAQDFGLFQGSRITGTVFRDNGSGGGIANNGQQEGGEAGLLTVAVTATDGGSMTYDTDATNSTGNYTLFVPASATTVHVRETNLTNMLSTGARVGTTGGAYDRQTDTVNFTQTTGTVYTGVSFGDVPSNTLVPDGQQNALPGAVVFYAHTFTARTAGNVTFVLMNNPTPTVTGWSVTLYHDIDCSATLDSGEDVISSSINVAADEQVCLIVREFVPAAAPIAAQNLITLTANFTYTNAIPALTSTVSRTDLTTVETSSLVLIKSVDKATALPGEVLTYTITYHNTSSSNLFNLTINDTTPTFTTFVSASCILPLPASLVSCTLNPQPAVGGTGPIAWTFTGSLAPSVSGTVQLQVQIDP